MWLQKICLHEGKITKLFRLMLYPYPYCEKHQMFWSPGVSSFQHTLCCNVLSPHWANSEIPDLLKKHQVVKLQITEMPSGRADAGNWPEFERNREKNPGIHFNILAYKILHYHICTNSFSFCICKLNTLHHPITHKPRVMGQGLMFLSLSTAPSGDGIWPVTS